jgi:hypothetical protein
MQLHEQVKMAKRGYYAACKGMKYRDRPTKRVALSEMASNLSKESSKHQSTFRCKQCDVHLCKDNSCFGIFH